MRTDVFDKKSIREGPLDIVKKSPELILKNCPIRKEDMPSCDDCGLLFENIHNLQKRVKNWCHISNKRKRENDEFLIESPRNQSWINGCAMTRTTQWTNTKAKKRKYSTI